MVGQVNLGLIAFAGRGTIAAFAISLPAQQPQASQPAIEGDYTRTIAPLFQSHCVRCHGPAKQRKGLRLDRPAGIRRGGKSGQVILAGNARQSLLYQRVAGLDGHRQMPLKAEPLADADIARIAAWIDAGARMPADKGPLDDRHWAYRPLKRPRVPLIDGVGHPIDRFVRAKLSAHGLEPSPPADAPTLVRRLALDLTGLQPAEAELDAISFDPGLDPVSSATKRLLASPDYAERWAGWWLDFARYADTKGYEKDGGRTIWRYRDWVIDSFDRDLPFDQFTVWQLAGDLLPDATLEQRLATAFHRNTMSNDEGGTDDEEFRVEAVADRLETTFQTWQATTIGCARCHDHKYDPLSQREYYQLFAFFNNTADSDKPDDRPKLPMPARQQRAAWDALTAATERLRSTLEADDPGLDAEQTSWEHEIEKRLAQHRQQPPVLSTWRAIGPLATSNPKVLQQPWPIENSFDYRSTLDGKAWQERPEWVDGSSHLFQPEGRTTWFLQRELSVSTTRRVLLSFGSDDGLRVWLDGKKILERDIARAVAPDQDSAEIELSAGRHDLLVKIANTGGISGFYFDLRATPFPKRLTDALGKAPKDRNTAERKLLRSAFRESAPSLLPVRTALSQLAKHRNSLAVPQIPILEELAGDQRRQTYIMRRGSFLSRGDEVSANTPTVLPPMPEDAARNRLGLARWLVDRRNPLTARVLVNRVWEQLFGQGLVLTGEDFGTQGEPPTHPLLLDWLAVHFIEDCNWSLKALLRTITSSATYRQSSVHREALREADPYNRLLARGPRVRLSAEAIRDSALRAAGLLSAKRFGPSVMPPQPDGIWTSIYSHAKWRTSPGENRYRRALYTYWKRTAPYPSMETFDTPSREVCVVRRVRTNTPLQALVTLNDPVYVEAAIALGRRMLAVVGSDEDRVTRGYRLCLSRIPDAAERAELLSSLQRERKNFRRDVAAARALVGAQIGTTDHNAIDQAAWTLIAATLLNLDEFLTKP